MERAFRQLGFFQEIPTFRKPVADCNAGAVGGKYGHRFGTFVIGIKRELEACTQSAELVLLEEPQSAHTGVHYRLTAVDIGGFISRYGDRIDALIEDMSFRSFQLTDIVSADIQLPGSNTFRVGPNGNGSC